MPKTKSSGGSALKFAPYVPLRGAKVFTQLALKKQEPLIHNLVQQFGGTVATTCEAGVNYVVIEDCASTKVQAYVDEQGGRVTMIEKDDMVQRLKDMCTDMCPVKEGELVPTIKFRDTLFPVRVANFPRMGTVFPDLDFQDLDFSFQSMVASKVRDVPEVDILYVVSRKGEADVWADSVMVHRCQVMAKKNGKSFFAVKTCNTLYHLCHRDTFNSSAKKFKSRDEAIAFLVDGEMLDGIDLNTVQPGVVALPEDGLNWKQAVHCPDFEIEVLKVWWPDSKLELSDYEPVTDESDE